MVGQKSTIGYIVFCGDSPISWTSSKQECVAGPTMEEEFVVLNSCTKDIFGARKIMKDRSISGCKYPTSSRDNQATIQTATHENLSARINHMDIQLNFCEIKLPGKELFCDSVPSSENLADITDEDTTRLDYWQVRIRGVPKYPNSRITNQINDPRF